MFLKFLQNLRNCGIATIRELQNVMINHSNDGFIIVYQKKKRIFAFIITYFVGIYLSFCKVKKWDLPNIMGNSLKS